MAAPGRVTFQTAAPAIHVGGSLSLKAVFNFGSRRESECDRICEKVEKIHRIVADQANYIHPRAMATFLDFVNRFVEARIIYYRLRDEQGASNFFDAQSNDLKERGLKLVRLGKRTYREGVAASTSGSSTRSICQLYHRDPPKNSVGRCLACFPNLPILEPEQGARAFLTWEAYLESFEREDILTAVNQEPQVAEGSPADPGPSSALDTGEMTSAADSTGNYLGLEAVAESEIPSMWQSFSAFFTQRSRGDSTRQ